MDKYITEFAPSCGFPSKNESTSYKQVHEKLRYYLNKDPHPGYKLHSFSIQSEQYKVFDKGVYRDDTWNEFVLIWEKN